MSRQLKLKKLAARTKVAAEASEEGSRVKNALRTDSKTTNAHKTGNRTVINARKIGNRTAIDARKIDSKMEKNDLRVEAKISRDPSLGEKDKVVVEALAAVSNAAISQITRIKEIKEKSGKRARNRSLRSLAKKVVKEVGREKKRTKISLGRLSLKADLKNGTLVTGQKSQTNKANLLKNLKTKHLSA